MKSKSTTTKKRTKAVQLASLRYVRTVKMGERWNTYLQIDHGSHEPRGEQAPK